MKYIALYIISGIIAGCVPNVTYKGKYGTYTTTPSGVVILPYYAFQSAK